MYHQVNQRNNLFPVFLKLEELDTLLVGGGNVGLEKLNALLKSSPGARVKVVSKTFHEEILTLAGRHPNVRLIERGFRTKDLQHKDLIILATDDPALHQKIRDLAKQKRILVNVADTPALCDFYLGSVVTKGNIKVGISTNGKSPTIAKRMREFFEDAIPENVNDLLDNMHSIRDRIAGDFRQKVATLNEITAAWLKK
jgi:precorrin-2 dehydrogenase / sirohydrochlorin ferrochelatase